jgi:O-antigen ligase
MPRAGSSSQLPGDRALLGVLGLAVALYFVVRGWLGASLALAGLASVVLCIVHRDELGPLLRDRRVRWLLAALTAPLAAALAVNAWHGELVARSIDGPLRLFLAGALMLELARRRLDFVRAAHFAFPAALLLCAAWIYLVPSAPRYFWQGRFATYFIDPLMLCQHAMIAGFICLFLVDRFAAGERLLAAIKVAAMLLAILIALGTQARTGWLMVPLLILIWILRFGRRPTPLRLAAAAALVVLGCVLAYWASSVVRGRFDQAVVDVVQYLNGTHRDSSVGIRISLFRVALLMFADHPLMGWGLGALPDLKTYAPAASFYSPALDFYFVTAGIHNEFLQAMMRMGVVGLLSRLVLYLVPLWFFARGCRSPDPSVRTNAYLGLVVVIGYLTAAMSTEVSNLIYAASFYGLLVAVFAAGTLREKTA